MNLRPFNKKIFVLMLMIKNLLAHKIMVRVFAKSRETVVQFQDESNKRQKIALDTSLFNAQYYKVRIKDKWKNPGKGEALFPTVVAIEK